MPPRRARKASCRAARRCGGSCSKTSPDGEKRAALRELCSSINAIRPCASGSFVRAIRAPRPRICPMRTLVELEVPGGGQEQADDVSRAVGELQIAAERAVLLRPYSFLAHNFVPNWCGTDTPPMRVIHLAIFRLDRCGGDPVPAGELVRPAAGIRARREPVTVPRPRGVSTSPDFEERGVAQGSPCGRRAACAVSARR